MVPILWPPLNPCLLPYDFTVSLTKETVSMFPSLESGFHMFSLVYRMLPGLQQRLEKDCAFLLSPLFSCDCHEECGQAELSEWNVCSSQSLCRLADSQMTPRACKRSQLRSAESTSQSTAGLQMHEWAQRRSEESAQMTCTLMSTINGCYFKLRSSPWTTWRLSDSGG